MTQHEFSLPSVIKENASSEYAALAFQWAANGQDLGHIGVADISDSDHILMVISVLAPITQQRIRCLDV